MSEPTYSDFWRWARGEAGSIIDMRPIEEIGKDADAALPGVLPSLGDWVGSILDASDPFGVILPDKPTQTTPGAINSAAAAFGSGFGNVFGGMAGLAVVLAVGYVIFKTETRSVGRSRR